MATVLGLDAKAYFSATALDGSNTASVSWTLIDNIRDATLNLDKAEADITTRAASGWRQTVGTLKEGSIEFEMVWDTSDAAFTAIKNAWLNNTEISMAFMDGAIATSGNEGLAANFSVTAFSRNEPLEEAITTNVTVKTSSQPEWYVVA